MLIAVVLIAVVLLVPARPIRAAAGTAAAAAAGTPPATGSRSLVVCAPGYPGTTEEAQPTMDAFARAAESAAGWKTGSLHAVYDETLEGGRDRMKGADSVLAIVTLPFLLQEGPGLGLQPRFQVVEEDGDSETWSLVAHKGAVTSPAALDGWEIASPAGYAPGFVRTALAGWGRLPDSVRISFAPAVLSGLKRAASGAHLALLLDSAATASLASLPFAGDLEVVTRSPRMPGSFFCLVRDRLGARDSAAILKGMEKLEKTPAGAEALKGMRLAKFEPVDQASYDAVRSAYARVAGGAK
ncbi:MAG TPA: hypothetical protein VFB49_09455 [Patescibacteria group bacterium]|nr:hypothetical protein [Patescibacteria group bacterium]